MKANEIQIGDWLHYEGHNAFPFKVKSITKKKVGYHAEPNEHRMYYLKLSECKPISLTPEILEKNGFMYFHKNYASLSYEHPFKLKMTNWPDENDLDGLWTICDIIEIRFVHQLQHALRLCGINHEIIL